MTPASRWCHWRRSLSFANEPRISPRPDTGAVALAHSAAELGPVHTLVCGAAGNFVAPAEELSANGFKAVVDIDLLGSFNAARAAFAQLKETRGNIVFISAGQASESLQEFKVLMVLPEVEGRPDPVPQFLAAIDPIQGLGVVSTHPPKVLGKTRVEMIARYVEDYEADGFVINSIKSCNSFSAGQLVMLREIEERSGVPGGFIETDLVDPRYFSASNVKNRLESYFQMLAQRSGRRTSGALAAGAVR